MLLLFWMGVWAAAELPGAEAYLQGRAVERQADYAGALAHYAACMDAGGPLTPYALARSVICLASTGDPRALPHYERLTGEYSDGPWMRMAKADLAQVYAKQGKCAEAAALFSEAIDVRPRPWWFGEYEWAAAENLLAAPDTQTDGYAEFRKIIEVTPYRAPRLDAARRLAKSPAAEDRFLAVEVMVRYGAYTLARDLLPFLLPSAAVASSDLPRWEYLHGCVVLGTGKRADGCEILKRVAQGSPNTVWGRRALAHLARGLFQDRKRDAAQKVFDQLVVQYPDTEETGDALWWHARTLADDWGEPSTAVEVYLRLAECCPNHANADDSLLAAAELQRSLGRNADAITSLGLLVDRYPRSLLVAEAHYRTGVLQDVAGDRTDAQAAFAKAAQGPLGSYYVHRAYARLGETDKQRNRTRLNGAEGLVAPLPIQCGPPSQPREEWVSQDWYKRLCFFGDNGLEEAEWEGLYLGQRLSELPQRDLVYQVLADAGLAATAVQLARTYRWGENDGKPTIPFLRVSFPRAYWTQVQSVGRETGLDPYLLLAVARQESTFRPRTMSSAGARGVMQVMPSTAEWLARVEPSVDPEKAKDLEHPGNSIQLGAYYLMRMAARFDGNLVHALAAYNAGPGRINTWRKKCRSSNIEKFLEEGITFRETREFVKKVLANYAAYKTLYAE